MTDIQTGIDTGALGVSPEVVVAPEAPTREQVLNAFNSSFVDFELATNLTPQQQAARDKLRGVKSKTLDKGKDSYRTSYYDVYGKSHAIREYVPIDDLIEFLASEVEKEGIEPEKRDEIRENLRILNQTGKSYRRNSRRLNPLTFGGLVHKELKRIQSDPRLSAGDENADNANAAAIINKRIELVFPREVSISPSPESEVVEGNTLGEDVATIPIVSNKHSIRGSDGKFMSTERAAELIGFRDPVQNQPTDSPTEVAAGHGEKQTPDARPQLVTVPPDLQRRMEELTAEGKTNEEIDQILRGERGNNWKDAIKLTDAPSGDGVPSGSPADLAAEPSSALTPQEILVSPELVAKLPPDVQNQIKEFEAEGMSPETIAMALDEMGIDLTSPAPTSPASDATSAPMPPWPPAAPPFLRRMPAPAAPLASPLPISTAPALSPVALPPTPITPVPLIRPGASAPSLATLPTPFAPIAPTLAPVVTVTAEAEVDAPVDVVEPEEELAIDASIPPEEEPPTPPEPEPDPDPEGPATPPTPAEVREYAFMIASRASDVDLRARELAEEHLRTEIRRGSIFNPLNWKRKIGWRMVEHGMRQHFTERARNLLVTNGNSYAELDLARDAARDASANRGQEYQAGLAKVEAIRSGEASARSGLVQDIGAGPLRDTIMRDILRPAIDGTITDISQAQNILRQFVIDNQADAQVSQVFGRDASQYGEIADYFATDLLETARQIREDVSAHRFSLDQLDSVVKIQLANARWGANTQRDQTQIDRFIQWSQGTRLKGSVLNPAVIGAGFSLATYGLTAATGSAARAGSAVPLVGAIPGALFAATRRAHDLNVDITTHRIERTYNQTPLSPDARRRMGLEQFSYLTASIGDLRRGYSAESKIPTSLGGDKRGFEELLGLDLSQEGNRNALMRRVADARARLDFSVGFKVDMITFDSRFEVEQGRLQVVEDIARAITALRNAGVSEADMSANIDILKATFQAEFTENVQAQDRAFSGGTLFEKAFTSYRARQSLKAGAFGGAVGIAGGLVSQQLLATGLRMTGANIGPTTLETFADSVTGNVPQAPVIPETAVRESFQTLLSADAPMADSKIGGHSISIPQGTEWVRGGDGKLDLVLKSDGRTLLDEVSFDKRGLMHFDESSSWADNVSQERGERISREVLGKKGLWNEASSHVDRREWYRYNTPGHYEKNELRFTTGKRGDAVILNLEGMGLGREDGLKPNPIDVKDLKSRGFFITLGKDYDSPIWIPTGADGNVDGRLKLDPDDYKHFITRNGERIYLGDIAKMVINQDALRKLPDGNIATELYGRRDVFSIARNGQNGSIEAGRLIQRDGKNVAQIFATILGSEQAPKQVVTFGNPNIEITPAEIRVPIQIEVPSVEDPLTVPPIVLPFAPRYPLEPLRHPRIRETVPPGYGYGYNAGEGLNEQQADFYRDRRSERLRENPNITLDPSIEIPDYLTRQSTEYMQELDSYLAQEGMQEPMNENADVVVAIPAYDLGEGQIIQNTLEQYYLQIDGSRNKNAIDPSRMEIIIFLNHPRTVEGESAGSTNPRGREALDAMLGRSYLEGAEGRVRSGNPERYDTEEVIRQFAASHPELRIRVMKKEFDTRPQWSNIIKPLYDAALLRSTRRSDPFRRDVSIVTNDADVVTLSPTYIKDILDTMTANEDASREGSSRKLDAIVGKTDMPNHGFENAPGFLAAMRLSQYLTSINQKRPGWQPFTIGRNSIFRGSSYAAIGGVNTQQGWFVDAGADSELGRMIGYARENTETIEYVNKAWLNTDPRREFGVWQSGVPLVWTWNDWAAMSVYGSDWKNQVRTANPDPRHVDQEVLSNEINASVKYWGLPADSKEISRALAWLGLKPTDYHIEPDGIIEKDDKGNITGRRDAIVIDSIDSVVAKLEAYVSEQRWQITERKVNKSLNPTTVTGKASSAVTSSISTASSAVSSGVAGTGNKISSAFHVATGKLPSLARSGAGSATPTPPASIPTPIIALRTPVDFPTPLAAPPVLDVPVPVPVSPPGPEPILGGTPPATLIGPSPKPLEEPIPEPESLAAGLPVVPVLPESEPEPESEELDAEAAVAAPAITPVISDAEREAAEAEERRLRELADSRARIAEIEVESKRRVAEVELESRARVAAVEEQVRLRREAEAASSLAADVPSGEPDTTAPVVAPAPVVSTDSLAADAVVEAPGPRPTTFQRTVEAAVRGANEAQKRVGIFAENPDHRVVRSVAAIPMAASVRDFKEVSKLAGQIASNTPQQNVANVTTKAGISLGTISGIAGRRVGKYFSKKSK